MNHAANLSKLGPAAFLLNPLPPPHPPRSWLELQIRAEPFGSAAPRLASFPETFLCPHPLKEKFSGTHRLERRPSKELSERPALPEALEEKD